MAKHTAKISFVSHFAIVILAGTATSVLASNPLNFADEAVARGFDYDIGVNFEQFGAGNGLIDLDGDGDLDIVIAGAANDMIGIFENDGTGNFTDRSATSGMSSISESTGLNGADYDNDGDIDIFVGGWMSPSRLYRNNGDMTFTDVTVAAGVSTSCPGMGSSWSDINNDGHLDLYVSVRTFTFADPTNNFFFLNNGDGTFTEQGALLGIHAPNDPTLLSAFFDYDRDGDDDLYLGTDKGSQMALNNRLYRNDGGTFTEVTAKTNAYAYLDCMGIAVGDINFDGKFDLYMTNVFDGNLLLLNDGNDVFVDHTAAAGVGNFRIGWGTVFADFDNDSELDIYLCNMAGDNRLYRGSQAWPLIDEAPSANVDEESNVFCVSIGDVDGDGDLDMLVGDTNGKAHLYINHSPDTKVNSWIRFNVVGNNANIYGIGTCVEVLSRGRTQLREVRSGVNYKSQDEYTLHYGLGAITGAVPSVSMVYPGGEVRSLTNAPMNQTWTLFPQARLGDADNNGQIDLYEFVEAVGFLTAPGESIVPGQEIYDMDGDFDIDFDDLADMGFGIANPSVFTGTRHN